MQLPQKADHVVAWQKRTARWMDLERNGERHLALAINDHCFVISNIMQLCFHGDLLLVSVRMFIEPSYADCCWFSALVVLL
jgi:hypothetical protein